MQVEDITSFWAIQLYGSSLGRWLTALIIAVLVYLALLAVRATLVKRLRQVERAGAAAVADWFASLLRRTSILFLLVVALYAGAYVLRLPPEADRVVTSALIVALFVQMAIWGSRLAADWAARYAEQREGEPAAFAGAISLIRVFARVVVWSIALLLILDNLGFDVTALVAGLGIGGIAIGLAAQRILGDLFASLAIVLDKPFVVGDFVIFGDYLGTIEQIGLKTTRIRSLTGEEIVCPNSDLLGSRIRNYKTMAERRIVFALGVVYETPHDKLQRIPDMLREIVESQSQTRFDRAHFKQFGDFSLNFEVVYYMLVPDYVTYMDTQQRINMEIYRRFEQEGIAFAYPTQSLYLHRAPNDAEETLAEGIVPAG